MFHTGRCRARPQLTRFPLRGQPFGHTPLGRRRTHRADRALTGWLGSFLINTACGRRPAPSIDGAMLIRTSRRYSHRRRRRCDPAPAGPAARRIRLHLPLAGDAQEARRRLSAQEFALTSCNVNRPWESGLDLARQVLKAHPQTAAVMVGGWTIPSWPTSRWSLAPNGYLLKPFEPNEILINAAKASASPVRKNCRPKRSGYPLNTAPACAIAREPAPCQLRPCVSIANRRRFPRTPSPRRPATTSCPAKPRSRHGSNEASFR